MQHLFDRHRNLLVFGDSLDSKLAQMIALNGLILSFVLIKSADVKSLGLYISGLSLIILAIIIGILGYKSREWLSGVKEDFFMDYDSFAPGEGIKILKEQLIEDIEANTITQNQKALIFDRMLYIDIIGFIVLVVGYYVG